MREEDSNWFSKWEEELPSPEELTPLSQTLISRDLALAFDIQTPYSGTNFTSANIYRAPAAAPPSHQFPVPGDFDSSGSGGNGGGSDEPARTLKRPRLVWTPQLHKRFVDAVAHLGIKNAVPKTIMQLMSVDGLTRENVASHLQKYRLYLKRMQGISSGSGGGGGGSGDSATDHLFASSPVPAHFLHPQGSGGAGGGGGSGGRGNSEGFIGYVGPPPGGAVVAGFHQQQQVAAMVAGGQYHHHSHQPHHRQMGHFGSSGGGGGWQASMGGRLSGGGGVVSNSVHGYVEDVNGRKALLTLFPSAAD